jgi:hypothetical protein
MAPNQTEWQRFLARDVAFIMDPVNEVSRIYMLPGWEDSRGALLEKLVGEYIGMGIYDAESGHPL